MACLCGAGDEKNLPRDSITNSSHVLQNRDVMKSNPYTINVR